ncbi:receptor-like kinase [Zea mays]|uniref:Receptor-like kinase n=1 Tax=Zea mays TaxID=4577 RepID=A0A1D6EDB1_MAIZE|nr:receptor-like kinase [Zea mays]
MAFFCIYLFRGFCYSHCSILGLLQIYYYSIRQQCGCPQGAPCLRPLSATLTVTQDSRFSVHVQSKSFSFILNMAEDYIHVFFFPDYSS